MAVSCVDTKIYLVNCSDLDMYIDGMITVCFNDLLLQ